MVAPNITKECIAAGMAATTKDSFRAINICLSYLTTITTTQPAHAQAKTKVTTALPDRKSVV